VIEFQVACRQTDRQTDGMVAGQICDIGSAGDPTVESLRNSYGSAGADGASGCGMLFALLLQPLVMDNLQSRH